MAAIVLFMIGPLSGTCPFTSGTCSPPDLQRVSSHDEHERISRASLAVNPRASPISHNRPDLAVQVISYHLFTLTKGFVSLGVCFTVACRKWT
jgi:hypothetical protein